MSIGIYFIRNITNGYFYVGSARNCKKRWLFHQWKLNKNTHTNTHLQRAWNKYGKDSFIFEIQETCSVEKLLLLEQVYLDKYVGLMSCYNIAKNATAPMLGRHHSTETKKKIGASNAIANLGNPSWNQGGTSWSKGLHFTEIHKHRIGESNKKIVGEATSAAKFTEEQVLWMRKVYDGPKQTAKYSSKKLAKKFDVHPSAIMSIINRKTWRHI